MAVPAHDSRDYEFANKFGLPIIEVISGGDISKEAYTSVDEGTLVNSDFLNGLSVKDAISRITEWLQAQGIGTPKVNYKLRDWVFSRQRYWGEPIPLVSCDDCGFVPVPEDELPVKLPDVEHYEPTDTGESPLANIESFVNTTCPRCGKPAKRETDTMPNWAGSSWYFLRYTDPRNDKELASWDKLSYWLPVDWYNGGMEHTTLHLLYSRFWHKFLYDCGLVPTPEPYSKRTSHGMILGEDNEKMSKSRGNVVNPDDLVREFGADTFRVYEVFLGAFDQASPWSQQGVRGCRRFLDRVWRLQDMVVDGDEYSPEFETLMHQTAKKVSEDIERMKFNTAIAALMTLVNAFYERGQALRAEFRDFLILLNPFAPHISEELWERTGFAGRISDSKWVQWDESKAVEETIDIPVQVNGKIRGTVTVARSAEREEIRSKATENKAIAKFISDRQVVREVYVPGKIYSVVVK